MFALARISLFIQVDGAKDRDDYVERDEFSFGNRGAIDRDAEAGDEKAAAAVAGADPNAVAAPTAMPPTSVMTRLILIMVWRKLIRNPNTYSSLIGVIWSLVSYRSPNRCQFLIFSISRPCICVVSYAVCAL